jgi:ATP-dependent RNA helicase DeaD
MGNLSFGELGLSPELLKAVEALGFEQASPIQAAAIPVLMSGRDVVGQSQTGSGKTAAFAIPAIEKIDAADTSVQVLILCPTRELATQVASEVHKLTAFKRGVHSVPIYGGASYDRQFFELKKGVQVVIGTPGRLIDHIERGTLRLETVKVVILDEADRMLDMGFREDIEKILDATPDERQTVFFSATVSKPIRELINRYAKNPESVKIEQKEVSAPAIEQWFYETHSRAKMEALTRLIDFHGFKLGIIFCNTQRMVDELADALTAQGFAADRLHGGIAQAQRTRVMNKFKKSEFEFLVATDVAARGIDVDDLELVVNYDLPYDAEDYVHRIGRTGRAGKRGMAVTFVSGREIYKLQFIERFTRTKIQRGKLPTAGEVEERRTENLLDKVRSTLETGEWKTSMAPVERLLEEGISSTDLAATLFHLLAGGLEVPAAPAKKDFEEKPRHFESGRSAEKDWKERPAREQRSEKPWQDRAPREERAPERDWPVREEKSFDRAPREERSSGSVPYLKKPAPGKLWVSVDVGRDSGYGPREIVDLFSEGAGLDGRSVGAIELTPGKSYVQVPDTFAKGLSGSGNSVTHQGVEVTIRKVPAPGPGSEKGGFFDKKKSFHDKPFKKSFQKKPFRDKRR